MSDAELARELVDTAKKEGSLSSHLGYSRLEEAIAALLARVRLDEAKWWKPKADIGHRYDCSLDSTYSPEGDFCDCDRKQRDAEVSERIASLKAAAKEGGK